jgi:hypothetical protein
MADARVDWLNRNIRVRRTRQRDGMNAPKTEDSTRRRGTLLLKVTYASGYLRSGLSW